MKEAQKLTPVSELGEFRLIEKLLSPQQGLDMKHMVVGPGDDAAAVQVPQGEVLVISSDSYAEGVHFDLVYTPLGHLGYKVVAGTVSDIAAMNASPLGITVNLSLSSKFTVEAVEELYRGIYAACDRYNIPVLGGDTTSSHVGLFISVTALGSAREKDLVRRSTARPGDLIVVTGDLGGAYVGLQILEREKRVFLEVPDAQPDLARYHYLLQRQLRPEARIDIKPMLDELGVKPTSMIDISDGLASELFHVCTGSGTGCEIREADIPMDDLVRRTAIDLNLEPTLCALSGGEDYELLFTVPPSDKEKISGHPDFTIIGQIIEGEKYLMRSRSGNLHTLKAQGWQHFDK